MVYVEHSNDKFSLLYSSLDICNSEQSLSFCRNWLLFYPSQVKLYMVLISNQSFQSDVFCIAVLPSLIAGGWSLCSKNLSSRSHSQHCSLSYCTCFFPFHYKLTRNEGLCSSAGSVEITEGISLFSQPSPVDKCKEGVINEQSP